MWGLAGERITVGMERKGWRWGRLEGRILTSASFPQGWWSPPQTWLSLYFFIRIVLVLIPNYPFRASQSLDKQRYCLAVIFILEVICALPRCHFALKVSEEVGNRYWGLTSPSPPPWLQTLTNCPFNYGSCLLLGFPLTKLQQFPFFLDDL